MTVLIKILQFVLSFSLLVIIHELGHFMFARIFKVRVEKFYLFFNPWFSLFKFKKGDTEYGIGWVPFGGYVKISGMIDESMDTEQMKKPPQPWEFRSKPAWQRLLIMVGGVMMNIVLAIAIFIGMSRAWGDKYYDNQDIKYGYVFNDLAREIGFRNGDRIIDVAGEPVNDVSKIYTTIVFDQAPYVTVKRDGRPVRIEIPEDYISRMLRSPDFMLIRSPFVISEVTPGSGAFEAGLLAGDTLIYDESLPALALHKGETVTMGLVRDSAGMTRIIDVPVRISAEGTMGVTLTSGVIPIRTRTYTFWESVPAGFKKAGTEIRDYLKQIRLIASPKTEAYKSVGGVLAIGNIFPGAWNWYSFWRITALLSVMLAVLNIMPIPVLDGGHVLFLLYEVITRRKPSDKFMEHAQIVGLILLFSVLILANGNDIYRIFIK